jgi:hypothetical protein
MLQLFYTGATAPGAAQLDAGRSLGGYVSATPLADDELNNLFGDITPLGMQYAGPETYGLALRNLGPLDATGLKIGYVYPRKASVKLEVAAVALYEDSCGKPTMQPLTTRRSRPQGAEFHELEMRRATATLELEVGFAKGDYVHLLVDGIALTPAIAVNYDMDLKEAATYLAQQVNMFSQEYEALVVADKPHCVELERNTPGPFTGVLELDTDGTGYADSVVFAEGLDNSASLGDLAKKEVVGLWFRRTLLPAANQLIPAKELELLPLGNRHREDLEIFISYDE